MYKNRSQGFTLIELLVVIAIIGILSSVVLASLNTARDKGNDAAIQSDLAAIATSAEIYYSDTSNTYGTATESCTENMFAEPTIAKAITAADTANGNTGSVICRSSGTAYAVQARLVAPDTASYWCVDSGGQATKSTTALAATTYVCP